MNVIDFTEAARKRKSISTPPDDGRMLEISYSEYLTIQEVYTMTTEWENEASKMGNKVMVETYKQINQTLWEIICRGRELWGKGKA